MKTTIVYFDPDFDSETYGVPTTLTDEEILGLWDHRVENVHRYTVEGFCTAFNNEYISDLGFVRAIEKR